MSQNDEFSISDLRRKREQSQAGGAPPVAESDAGRPADVIYAQLAARSGTGPGPRRPQEEADDESESEWSVDTGRVLRALKRRWVWLLVAALVLGCIGFAGGYHKGKYTATIKLIQVSSVGGSESLRPEAYSATTLTSLIQSPELIRRVAQQVQPPISAARLAALVRVAADPRSELIMVTVEGRDVKALADLVNLYANETVAFTRDLQQAEGRRMKRFYEDKVAKFDGELKLANDRLQTYLDENKIVDPKVESETYMKQLGETLSQIESKRIEAELATMQIAAIEEEMKQENPFSDQLVAAQARLDALLLKYKDQHPAVQDARAEIAELERQAAAGGGQTKLTTGSLASKLQTRTKELQSRRITLAREIQELERRRVELQKTVTGLSEKGITYSGLRAELDSLQQTRTRMMTSLREAQVIEESAQGYYRVFAPVSMDDVDTRPRIKSAISFGLKGAFGGLLAVAVLLFLVEMKDRTMKTVAEVERITGLRVLASLRDLDKMTPQEQANWAFRAWTVIAGQLSMSANHGMVCGVMSSEQGEGRSTWIRLLGSAASQRGLRVLTVATKASGSDMPDSEAQTKANEHSFTEAVSEAMGESKTEEQERPEPSGEAADTTMLSPSVLAFPAEVTQKFAAGGLPAAHIPLPGWVWNLERRRQWQMALAHWRAVENLVLLVELPPASVPESVLLAESLPQILWLVDSGKPRISETREQLEMLHHAKCRIVGAVLNHEPEPIIKL